jgi:hypothetical protein
MVKNNVATKICIGIGLLVVVLGFTFFFKPSNHSDGVTTTANDKTVDNKVADPTVPPPSPAPSFTEPPSMPSTSAPSPPTAPNSSRSDTSRTPSSSTPKPSGERSAVPVAGGSKARQLFGARRSGLPWHSGAWTSGAGSMGMDSLNAYGAWRGSQLDFVTTYSLGYDQGPTWADMVSEDNDWLINTYKDFPGKLNYGLALLASESRGNFSEVTSGSRDNVWTHIAQTLKDNGHGDAAVRLGWEFDIDAPGWPWVISADQADEYKAAYRHVVGVMRKVAPDLKFEFGVNCGSDLEGASDRLAPLTQVYPGDDVVDLVGCDTYNWWSIKGSDEASFQKAMHPDSGVGIGDVVDFARQHGKGASFGEWGTAVESNGDGGGDDAFYIKRMFQFFQDNKDVVAFECYFDEGDEYIANSLFNGQNPEAAAVYKQLWGK